MTIKFSDKSELIIGSTTIPENVTFRFSDILKLGGGGSQPSWQDIILSGNGSLTLTNAKANGLNYLKLFGDCEQTGTPTPDNPIDIVCNNGAIKYSANISNVNEQTALIGYYISSSGVVTADQFNWIYQEYIPVQPNTTYTLSFNISAYYVTISEYTTASDSGFVIRKAGQTGNNTKLTITTGSTTNFVRFGTNIDRTEVTLARVLGIEWMLNKGSVAISYTPYVEGGIYTDGTTETVEVFGKNLNGGGELENKGYTSTGGTSTSTTFCGTLWKIKVKEGEKYTVSYGNFPDGISGVFVNTWKTDGTWNLRQAISISSAYTYTIPAGIGEVNFTLYKTGGITIADNSWLQVEKGDTATDYEPYYNGGSATAEMLLGVGDYKDEQNVTSGHTTRNIGIKVFDGTETFINGQYGWITEDVQDQYWDNANPYAPICSHFVGTSNTPASGSNTVRVYRISDQTGRIYFGINKTIYTSTDVFKQWLADQYNAGTPVIIVYLLATPTTETVTGQHLNIQAGTNIVAITQASIDNLGLEVSYKGTV